MNPAEEPGFSPYPEPETWRQWLIAVGGRVLLVVAALGWAAFIGWMSWRG